MENTTAMDQDLRPNRERFWLMLAVGAALTSLIWLGVIETANARVGGVLQDLPHWPPARWAHRYFSLEEVQQAMVSTDAASQEAFTQQAEMIWTHEAGRNHLYRITVGFGTTLVLLSLLACISGILTMARPGIPPPPRVLGAAAAIVGATCLARALYLGVPSHGLLTALTG